MSILAQQKQLSTDNILKETVAELERLKAIYNRKEGEKVALQEEYDELVAWLTDHNITPDEDSLQEAEEDIAAYKEEIQRVVDELVEYTRSK